MNAVDRALVRLNGAEQALDLARTRLGQLQAVGASRAAVRHAVAAVQIADSEVRRRKIRLDMAIAWDQRRKLFRPVGTRLPIAACVVGGGRGVNERAREGLEALLERQVVREFRRVIRDYIAPLALVDTWVPPARDDRGRYNVMTTTCRVACVDGDPTADAATELPLKSTSLPPHSGIPR